MRCGPRCPRCRQGKRRRHKATPRQSVGRARWGRRWDLCPLGECPGLASQVGRIDRSPDLGAEDEAVVVPHIGAKNPLQMAPIYDQEVVEALRCDRSHEPLGLGIGIRAGNGVRSIGVHPPAKTVSKVATSLVSRSQRTNWTSTPLSSSWPATFLACQVTQALPARSETFLLGRAIGYSDTTGGSPVEADEVSVPKRSGCGEDQSAATSAGHRSSHDDQSDAHHDHRGHVDGSGMEEVPRSRARRPRSIRSTRPGRRA